MNSPAIWRMAGTTVATEATDNNKFHWFWLRDRLISNRCSAILTRRQPLSATDAIFAQRKRFALTSYFFVAAGTYSWSLCECLAWLMWTDGPNMEENCIETGKGTMKIQLLISNGEVLRRTTRTLRRFAGISRQLCFNLLILTAWFSYIIDVKCPCNIY